MSREGRKNEAVRPEILELSRHKALEPKSSASANSATGASRTDITRRAPIHRNRGIKL